MKRYLILALAALAVAITAPSAFATRHVIFDPPATSIPCVQNTPCNIVTLGTPYVVTFQPCSGLPPSANVPTSMDNTSDGCLWMANVSTGPANTFTFSFSSFTSGSSGQQLQCSSSPPNPATSDCPATVPASGPLTISFFANPPLGKNIVFFLFTDLATPGSTATVTASVPEPGELGLFGLGLLAIGVAFGWQRRCQRSRSKEAA